MFSKKLLNSLILSFLFIPVFFVNATELFFDNFDSYSAGYLNIVGPSNWFVNTGNGLTVSSGSSFSSLNYIKGNITQTKPTCSYTYLSTQTGNLYITFNLLSSNTSGYPIAIFSFFYDDIDCLNTDDGSGSIEFMIKDGNIWVYGKPSGGGGGTFLYDTGFTYNEGAELMIIYDISNYTYSVVGKTSQSSYFPVWSTYSGNLITSGTVNLFGLQKTSIYVSSVQIDDVGLYNSNPSILDGVCGSDNGQTIETYPTNFCEVGELIELSYLQTATGWQWACSGINGGEIAWCSATWGETSENAVCGADNVQILTSEPTNFCTTGQYLPDSLIRTATGWQWICLGVGSGNYVYCLATMDESIIIDFPELPEQEDCSSYGIPEIWFCEISNIAKSIFLPTSDKLNDLNISINQIQTKAPFNYIIKAQEKLSELKEVEEGSISISLMGNEGQINLSSFSSFFSQIKLVFNLLLSLGFLFWAVKYIKRVFS